MIFYWMIAAILLASAALFIRLFLGPTLHDRILVSNSFGTKIALLLAAMGFASERPEFLDLSILYVLLTFVGTIATLKFFEARLPSNEKEEKP